MLIVRRNQDNKLAVSVSRHKTLNNPYYLFSFQHILSKEKVQFYPKNISTSTNRYDEFEFIEGLEPDNYAGDVPFVIFPYPGQYYYSIFEMFNSGSTNPQYAYNKLEEGRCIVEDPDEPDVYGYTYTSSNENNSNYIYYEPGKNQSTTLVKFNADIFNSQSAEYSWSEGYPDYYFKNLETGVITKYEPYYILDDENYITCGISTRLTLDDILYEVKTGSTWAGFKIYYDVDDYTSKGYFYPDDNLYVTAHTINNIQNSFILPDLFYSFKLTAHYNDGTDVESTQPLGFRKDLSTPRPVPVFNIQGNKITPYGRNLNGFTGSTINDACTGSSVLKIYYNWNPEDDYWYTNTGTTTSYSLVECEQVVSDTEVYFANVVSGVKYLNRLTTDGNIEFVQVCS